MEGWIKFHRSIFNWEWYDDANTFRVFFHCVLRANHEEVNWRGVIIERGSFITSLSKLAKEMKLSIKQIRGSLNKLKRTGELTIKTTSKYSYIAVNNYNQYQKKDTRKGKQGAHRGHSEGTVRATNKNDKNNKNENNDWVFPNVEKSVEKLQSIADKYYVRVDFVENQIDKMENWVNAKKGGKSPYKNHRRALMNWVSTEADKLTPLATRRRQYEESRQVWGDRGGNTKNDNSRRSESVGSDFDISQAINETRKQLGL